MSTCSPPHHSRIEPFCGAIAPLLAKPPPAFEVVNDLDQELMHCWRRLAARGGFYLLTAA
jgi:hypothetical protein